MRLVAIGQYVKNYSTIQGKFLWILKLRVHVFDKASWIHFNEFCLAVFWYHILIGWLVCIWTCRGEIMSKVDHYPLLWLMCVKKKTLTRRISLAETLTSMTSRHASIYHTFVIIWLYIIKSAYKHTATQITVYSRLFLLNQGSQVPLLASSSLSEKTLSCGPIFWDSLKSELLLVEPSGAPGHKTTKL